MKRIVRPLLAATVLSVVLAAAALGAARLPSLLTGWNGRYTVRPTSIYYTGDGRGVVGVLRRRGGLGGAGRGYLHWKAWNGRGAYAVGSLWLKLATPTATSPFTRFAVSVGLGRPRFGHFTRMTLRYRLYGRGEIVKCCGLAMRNDQAATLSSCVVVSSSVTLMPSLNLTPSSTSATSSWPLNRRQRSWADSSSL